MTTSPSPVPLSVHGPDCLPALVPHLVGFLPDASLVLIGLGGREHRVRLTMRVDLPPADTSLDELRHELQHLLPTLARAGSDGAMVVVYPRADDDPWRDEDPRELPHRDLVDLVGSVLLAEGLSMLDALCVVGDRLRSYLCWEPGCCPPEGRTADASESLRIGAAFVAAGSAPLASRDELAATLAPRAEDDPLVLAVEGARVLLGDCEALLSVDDVESFHLGLVAWVGPQGDPHLVPVLVAMATALCQRIRPRDLLLRSMAVDLGPEQLAQARSVLAEAVRCAIPAETAPVASLLAVAAWLGGDGAHARVALDRALAADPTYSLATLVSAALDHGTPPWEWAQMMRELPVEAILEATGPRYDLDALEIEQELLDDELYFDQILDDELLEDELLDEGGLSDVASDETDAGPASGRPGARGSSDPCG